MPQARRYYICKGVFFEVHDNGLVILKAKGREVTRKRLHHSVSKFQVGKAFRKETEELRTRGVVTSPHGFKAYYKPSLGKIVLRKPRNRRQRRKKQNHEHFAQ